MKIAEEASMYGDHNYTLFCITKGIDHVGKGSNLYDYNEIAKTVVQTNAKDYKPIRRGSVLY